MKLENCVFIEAANDRYGLKDFVSSKWKSVLHEYYEGVISVDETEISRDSVYDADQAKALLDQFDAEWLFIIADESSCKKAVELNKAFNGTKYKIGILSVLAKEALPEMNNFLYMFIEEVVSQKMYSLVRTCLENKECKTKMLLLEFPTEVRDQLIADMTVRIQSAYKLSSWKPKVVTLLHSVPTTAEELTEKLEQTGSENVLFLVGKRHPLNQNKHLPKAMIKKVKLRTHKFSEESAFARFVNIWIESAAKRLDIQNQSFVINQMVPYSCAFPQFLKLSVLEHEEYEFRMDPSYERRMERLTPGMTLDDEEDVKKKE